MKSVSNQTHIIWFDLLRIIAFTMVVIVHASSSYFFNFQNSSEHFWGNLFGSATRACVPLFVVLSGALLLPMKLSTTDFVKRRLSRVFFPFVIWSVIYVLLTYFIEKGSIKGLLTNLAKLPFQYSDGGLHLWYLYVLLGLYLIIPIISPWIITASKRDVSIFLGIWFFSMLVPMLRKVIPLPFGEAPWNSFGSFYYFSGYIGYLVLGYYLFNHLEWSRIKSIGIGLALFAAGAIFTIVGQQYVYTHSGGFNFQIWSYNSINVALMVIGVVLAIKNMQVRNTIAERLIIELSNYSFGIFLVHYFIVYRIHEIIYPLGLSAAITIPVNTVVTIIISYGIVKVISFLPGKKYIIG
jgi:surface polysaccharide O-acyltransferase-like enzyme